MSNPQEAILPEIEFISEAIPDNFPADYDLLPKDAMDLFESTNFIIEALDLEDELEGYKPPPTSPTNQDMHSLNGNIIPSDVETRLKAQRPTSDPEHERIKDLIYPTRLRKRHHNRIFDGLRTTIEDTSEGIKQLASKKYRHETTYPWNIIPGKPATAEEKRSELAKLQAKHSDWELEQHILPPPHKHKQIGFVSKPLQPPIFQPIEGPTNKEMHSYNGNLVPPQARPVYYGSKTLKQAQRVQKTRDARKFKRKEMRAVAAAKFVQKPTIAKSTRNRGHKRVEKIVSREAAIAARYVKFLKNPSFPPPRLGSSGNNPTNLIHGYFRASYSMAAPALAVVNATCVTACINPVMAVQFASATDYACPISICFTQTGNIKPTVANATGDFIVPDFANIDAMLRQTIGSNASDITNPLGRFVGGSITLECRCPMATTAPPFLFGGTIAQYPSNSTNRDTIDKTSQLTTFTPNSIRNLPSTKNVAGLSVSSVYVPNNARALEFSIYPTRHVTVDRQQQISAIPYVGMVGCPTAATVEVTVSCWFEVQQNVFVSGASVVNTADYGGWQLGPQVSAEDIFDNLKRFPPCTNKILDMGAPSNNGSSAFAAIALAERNADQKPIESITEKIYNLEQKFKNLSVQVQEQDEKYFDEEATPGLDKDYSELSQSTLDLAMSLKKNLTPGSATKKHPVQL